VTEVLFYFLATLLLVSGAGSLGALLATRRRDRTDRAVVEEALTRLEIDDLLHSDPREWIAEGEARAVAAWAEENPEPCRHPAEYASVCSRCRSAGIVPDHAECTLKSDRPPRIYGVECVAGQLPDFTCLCIRCQQVLRPRPRFVHSTITGLVLMMFVDLWRTLERIWDGMMRVLR
jgi:hypothetical protein